MTDTPKPVEINLHQKSRILELSYSDGERFELSYEFLRVHSPSAEVQGHGPGQGVLQIGKEDVNIERIEPIGHYAVRGKQAGQVLIPLYTTEEQQVEAVARGYTLRIDGRGGKITDKVLIEIAKER